VFAAALDVTSEKDVRALQEKLDQDFGAVDILVNNAGINIRGNIEDLSQADFEAVMGTNVTGSFLCAKVFGPGMCQRNWGRVINLGSILSVISMAGRTPYASSKAAVLGLTRTLALEWAGKGVTVNAICPGPFATDMNLQLLNDPAKYKAFVEKIPVGRWGELHEIAGAALFLASDAASYVTGNMLFVDGGWTAQ
jgi:NAD(P)-dependent dehydrogenase (short-subunit alcohol dehydrogenase family)